jgi:O-antigen ligase
MASRQMYRGEPRGGIDVVTLLTCYLFLLMAVPASLVVGPFGAAGQPAALFAVPLLGWYLLARQHPSLELDRARQPCRASAILFGCGVLAAYVSANRAAMPTLQSNGADRGLILIAGWLGVLLLAADGIDRADRLAVLLRRIVLGATAMAVLGLIEFSLGIDITKYIAIPGLTVHQQVTDLMTRAGLVRVNATASQPLEFSAVMEMSLPLAIHQARYAPRSLRFRRWLQVALIAGGVPMAVSRSAIFGLAIIGIMLVPTWPARERRRAYLTVLALPIVVWLGRPGILTSFATVFGQLGTDSSSASRATALSSAGPLIAQHPWFGQGFQTFFPQTHFFVDDQFLTATIETGVVGLAGLLALFWTGWYGARSARLAAADAQTKDLAHCLATIVVVAALYFATFDVLSFPIASGLYFLLLGCIGAVWRLTRADPRAERTGQWSASADSG